MDRTIRSSHLGKHIDASVILEQRLWDSPALQPSPISCLPHYWQARV